ncbi:conserved hypothetical protein [Beggiatoa sp. PS]|nr:conserved hypothetical protein [Beggiatoa sp. PS]
MKIYFDTCSLQRPLDNRSQLRIAIEAEAILGILVWLSETDTLDLISSDALVFEVERIPNVYRRHYVLEVLEESNIFIELNDEIETRAKTFHAIGIKPLDALHLDLCRSRKSRLFCT